jgi:hypothetical protein
MNIVDKLWEKYAQKQRLGQDYILMQHFKQAIEEALELQRQACADALNHWFGMKEILNPAYIIQIEQYQIEILNAQIKELK